MKKFSTVFLKITVFLVGTVVLLGLLRFPQLEGRAVGLDLVSIYKDPFIWFVYLGSTPFFIGLYQVFKALRLVEKNKVFTKEMIDTMKNIEYCAGANIIFVLMAQIYISFFTFGDDPAGILMLGLILIFVSVSIVAFCEILINTLKKK